MITFDPRPGYKASDNDLRFLKQIRGRAWIDEAELQILRVETEIIDDLKFGGGLLAKIQKGGTIRFDQQKINQEVWFLTRSEILLSGRVLLFKGFNFKIINQFYNFRKYETSVRIFPAESISPPLDRGQKPPMN